MIPVHWLARSLLAESEIGNDDSAVPDTELATEVKAVAPTLLQ